MAHHELGVTWLQLDRPEEAVEEFERAVRIDPRLIGSVNNLAWIRATHPTASLRDGPRAVELSESACKATNFANVSLLDTLAAAYAEAGRFDDAVKTIDGAVELDRKANGGSATRELLARQRLYMEQRPHRDTPR